MTEPSVSILLPVRNEERLLPAALDSIFRQTLTSWELVAVDDGSTDGTAQILEAASRTDTRVRVLRSHGRGLAAALNLGLDACRAPLVARMDGDDISHPRRLEIQADFMSGNPSVGLVAGSFRHFPRHRLKEGMLAYEKWQNALLSHDSIMRDLYVESPFVHPSVMFRGGQVLAVGGYRNMGWAEDYDLWLRLATGCTRFARLSQTLLFWRERPERATRTMPEYSAAAFRACKAHHLKKSFLKGADEVVLAGAGLEGRAWSRTLREEGISVACWVDVDPRKVGRDLHGAPVISHHEMRAGSGTRILATVGTRGAREQLRCWAANAGFTEGTDFLCVT
ncbi:MAG TPA: glycosyltransferase [Geobacteraceae bacterium]|nr:glycosyltransferase [Geobacteraceae bacterium]